MYETGRKLLVHAGRHKTGSSAIQQSLLSLTDNPDFEYIDIGGSNLSLIINLCFRPLWVRSNTTYTEEQLLHAMSSARETLERAVESTHKANVILSAEDVCMLDEGGFEKFLLFFRRYFNKIHLMAYFRAPKSDMESSFFEQQKYKLVSSECKIVFMHKRRFEIFERQLGRENISYFRYAAPDFPNGDVVAHFWNQLGLGNPPREELNVNPRLTLAGMRLFYMYRLQFPVSDPRDTALLEQLRDVGGPDFHFHSQLFKQNFRDPMQSFEWLEQRTKKSFDEDIEQYDAISIRGDSGLLQLDEYSLAWLNENAKGMQFQNLPDSERLVAVALWLRDYAVQLAMRSDTAAV